MPRAKAQVKFKSIRNYAAEIRSVQTLNTATGQNPKALQRSEVVIWPKYQLLTENTPHILMKIRMLGNTIPQVSYFPCNHTLNISFKLQLQQRIKIHPLLVHWANWASLLSELYSIETLVFSFYSSLEIHSSAYSLHYLACKLCLPHPAPSLDKTGW